VARRYLRRYRDGGPGIDFGAPEEQPESR